MNGARRCFLLVALIGAAGLLCCAADAYATIDSSGRVIMGGSPGRMSQALRNPTVMGSGILSASRNVTTSRLSLVQRPVIETFNPAKYKGSTGKIRFPYAKSDNQIVLQPAGVRKYIVVNSSSTEAVAPAGTYRVLMFATRPTGSKVYSLTCTPKGMQMEIGSGRTVVLQTGDALTALVQVKKLPRSQYSLSLFVTDDEGNSYTVRGKDAPRFQILSSSGQVLQQGAFRYG